MERSGAGLTSFVDVPATVPAQPAVATPVPDHTAVLPGVSHADFVRLRDDLVAAVARANIPLTRAEIVLARAVSNELVVRVSSDDAFLSALRRWDPGVHAALGSRPFAETGPMPQALTLAAIPGLGEWAARMAPGEVVRFEVLPSRGADAGTPPTVAAVPIHHSSPSEPPPSQATGLTGPGGVRLQADAQGRIRPIDRSGHVLRDAEIEFIGADQPVVPFDQAAIDRWVRGEAPLGMPPELYQEFRSSLRDALAADGIDPRTVDVRLKGSAADFYSGPRKSMPTAESLAADLAAGRISQEVHDTAVNRLAQMLPGADGDGPVARVFDTMYRLGLDSERSDYDLNISSDQMFRRALALWDEDVYGGIDLDGTREAPIRPADRNHGYLTSRRLIRAAFPALNEWAAQWDERLGRHMSYAVFLSSGAEDTTTRPGHAGVSVHNRDSDWMILRAEES